MSSSSLFEDDNFFETASQKPLKPRVLSEEEDEEEVVCICIFLLPLNWFRFNWSLSVKSSLWQWGLTGSCSRVQHLPYILCLSQKCLGVLVVELQVIAWPEVAMTSSCCHEVSETSQVKGRGLAPCILVTLRTSLLEY